MSSGIYKYEASASVNGKEKQAYDLISSQGANRIDRLLERGLTIDFTNEESNLLLEATGQLCAKRTHFFTDPKQSGDWFSRVGKFHTGPREFCLHTQTDRVIGHRVVRAEEPSPPRMYLEKIVNSEPSHFSWRIGESYTNYSGRLQSYEKFLYTRLTQKLPPLPDTDGQAHILRILKTEIISRLWICVHGFREYHVPSELWDQLTTFLEKWDQGHLIDEDCPGITVTECNAIPDETRTAAGEYPYLLFSTWEDVEKRLLSHKGFELDGYILFGHVIGPSFFKALKNGRYAVVVTNFGQSIGESAFNHFSSLPPLLTDNFMHMEPSSNLNSQFVHDFGRVTQPIVNVTRIEKDGSRKQDKMPHFRSPTDSRSGQYVPSTFLGLISEAENKIEVGKMLQPQLRMTEYVIRYRGAGHVKILCRFSLDHHPDGRICQKHPCRLINACQAAHYVEHISETISVESEGTLSVSPRPRATALQLLENRLKTVKEDPNHILNKRMKFSGRQFEFLDPYNEKFRQHVHKYAQLDDSEVILVPVEDDEIIDATAEDDKENAPPAGSTGPQVIVGEPPVVKKTRLDVFMPNINLQEADCFRNIVEGANDSSSDTVEYQAKLAQLFDELYEN